jgi:hypothetical protein
MVDRESVVSDVRWGYCDVQSVRAAPCPAPKPAFGRVRDGWPRLPAGTVKSRERDDAVRTVAADNAVFGSESALRPKDNRKTGYLYRLPT